MSKYPVCMSEWYTMSAAVNGANLARYGDGEFSIIQGGNCVSQIHDKELARELKEILQTKTSRVLPCLPTPYNGTPKQVNWLKFDTKQIRSWLNPDRVYGSAFISRPDSAPRIDTPEYWDLMQQTWRGKDVTLVIGTERSLRPDALPGAKSVKTVWGPRRDAYSQINKIIEEIGTPSGTVLLCLGPAATVLAERFGRKDIHAIDMGHMGMFWRHAGGYRYTLDDLSTPEYRALLEKMHDNTHNWGDDGKLWASLVSKFYSELKAVVLLDYGCGQGYLRKAIEHKGLRVTEFDIGRADKRGMPKPVDITVSTDVLEHVEPQFLDAVLDHIFSLSAMGVFLNISLRPAKAVLPDGRNAHLIIQPAVWWLEKLKRKGWKFYQEPSTEIKRASLTVWMVRDLPVLHNALGVRV